MELGGNAPFLIFDDADLDAAVEGALLAKMRNIGEACTSANRFHVAEPVRDEFARRLGERMGALKLGRGTEDDVKVGPLIDEPAREKVSELVEDALERGATKIVGGEIPDGRGYFYEPTVLDDVPDDARVFHEEIFGPVAPVGVFDSEEEAIAPANDTEYGLVAYVFTRDIKRAIRVCEGLDTGMVGLNQGMVSNAGAPFGGVKQSGIGREGGKRGPRGVPRDEVRGREHVGAGLAADPVAHQLLDVAAPDRADRQNRPDAAGVELVLQHPRRQRVHVGSHHQPATRELDPRPRSSAWPL